MPDCEAFEALSEERDQYIRDNIIDAIIATYGSSIHVPAFKESLDIYEYNIEISEFSENETDSEINLRCKVQYVAEKLKAYGFKAVAGNTIPLYCAEYNICFTLPGQAPSLENPSTRKAEIIDTEKNEIIACSVEQVTPFISTGNKMPPIQWGVFFGKENTDFFINNNELLEFYHHSGLKTIWHEDAPSRHDDVQLSFPYPHSGYCHSGRSGITTLLIKLEDNYEFNEPNFSLPQLRAKSYVIATGDTAEQRKMMQHATHMQQKLYDEGIPVPRLRKPLTDYYDTGQFYCIQEYINGHHFNPTIEQIRELGKILGEIHNLPADEAPETGIDTVVPTDIYYRDIRKALEWGERNPDYFSRMNRAFHNWQDKRAKGKKDFSHFPQGWVHGDIHGKNVLLSNKTSKTTLLDFQRTGKGYYINDLVLSLFFFCVNEEGKLNPEYTKAFFEGYCSQRTRNDPETGNIPLTKVEVSHLAKILSEMAPREDIMSWVMFKGKSVEFKEFAKRNEELPIQLNDFQQAPERFTEKFLNMNYHDLADFRLKRSGHVDQLLEHRREIRELVHS